MCRHMLKVISHARLCAQSLVRVRSLANCYSLHCVVVEVCVVNNGLRRMMKKGFPKEKSKIQVQCKCLWNSVGFWICKKTVRFRQIRICIQTPTHPYCRIYYRFHINALIHTCRLITIRSEWRKVLFLAPSVCGLFVYEISTERLNGFVPNSHGRHVWSLARTSLKVKVTRDKNVIFGPFGGLRVVCVS